MRHGRRFSSPSPLAGGEQPEQTTGLEWGGRLVGERLLAAARAAAAIHMARETALRLDGSAERSEPGGRAGS